MSQRREYVRLSGNRPVLVYAGEGRPPVHSYAVDLAAGGLLLAGPDVLEIGEQVRFQLTLVPDGQPIEGTGTVVRSDVRGQRAISFTEVSDLDRRRVVRCIFECERAEARRRREQEDVGGR